jgi:hypothetical protein
MCANPWKAATLNLTRQAQMIQEYTGDSAAFDDVPSA